jgi:uroporphyrinogen-III synthase
MMDQAVASGALTGRRVVIPESRALDLFSDMVARHGAEIVRCPLVTTARLADNSALDAWIGRLIDGRHDLVAFYTGEGVMKIVERAEDISARQPLLDALQRLPKLARGPKPLSALRKLGIEANVTRTAAPTTDGLLETIRGLDLGGKTVAVQLYPGAPEERLAQALREARAEFDPVLPYDYVSDEEDERVAEVIGEMSSGRVDLIAFTSQSQVLRLIEVAERRSKRAELDRALAAVTIAAVGPVTQQAVIDAGAEVHIQPAESFHMKPLVAEIVRKLGSRP